MSECKKCHVSIITNNVNRDICRQCESEIERNRKLRGIKEVVKNE